MSEPIETLASPCGRFRALIFNDPEPINPRLEYENVCTMLVWHRRYNLGDPSGEYVDAKGRRQREWRWGDSYKDRDWLEGRKLIEAEPCDLGPGLVLPLYLYDHSGLTISTGPFSCPWDSGQVGWIHCSYEKANEALLFGPLKNPRRSKTLRKKMLACMNAEVETYDQYLRGDVYAYDLQFLDEQGDWLVEESCCGVFDLDYARQEAKSLLDRYSRQVPTA